MYFDFHTMASESPLLLREPALLVMDEKEVSARAGLLRSIGLHR